jgi:phage shock protein A
VLALERDDEDLAREALRRKARSLKEAEAVRARAAEQATTADAMKAQLQRIEDKLDDLKSRQKTLAAQVRRARTQPADPSGAAGDRLGGGAFSDLDRMADQIDQLDAEVEAHDLLEDPKRTELDARFRALESEENEDGIEDELAALKAKLGG